MARYFLFAFSSVVQLVAGHPEKLICKDPRLVAGASMMYNYVVPNQFSDAMIFNASLDKYEAGTTVGLQVRANGTKFIESPKGVFIAIQSSSACTLNGDNGVFSDLSDDLSLTNGCQSGVFSKTTSPFKGLSNLVWTAGPGTKGDVTFTLVWSNGNGATDPLSKKGVVRVPDTYIYTKTITLSGPAGPCPPPAPVPAPPTPGSPSKCIAEAHQCASLEGVNSPVFIQLVLDDFDDAVSEVTFPAGRCIPCRADQRRYCKSARVTCPTEPGKPMQEEIWTANRECKGLPSRRVDLPSTFARCPSLDYYSPESIDLDRFVEKLQKDHASFFTRSAVAHAAIKEYRRMLQLIQQHPDQPVVPSKIVDLVWHEHILDTAQYKRDCLRMFGRYIHHNPSFGGEQEKSTLVEQQLQMFKLYKQTFDIAPPLAIWPTARKLKLGANGPLPDCCSAQCVKPACHDCVGCNSVDCGKLNDADEKGHAQTQSTNLARSPDAFAGYVPLREIVPKVMTNANTYSCKAQPLNGMTFEWSICSGRIYFKQSLAGVSAWYGVGLSGRPPFDMGFGDFMVSMFTRNFSGVKDLYKYDDGQGYPCWDVLHECSADNKTMGTKNTDNDQITRTPGETFSTWSRHLNTGDSKDWPIVPGNMTVLFAHGTEDYFTYHTKHNDASCQIDFFTGMVACGGAFAYRSELYV